MPRRVKRWRARDYCFLVLFSFNSNSLQLQNLSRVRSKTKAGRGEQMHLLVMMQAFDVILCKKLALRRLLGAIVLHALGEILSAV